MNYELAALDNATFRDFTSRHHYCGKVFPPHCMVRIGAYRDGRLIGAASWGWGTRPLHTIRNLFPSLGTQDYLELNRLCLLDTEPRNSESSFLRQCRTYLKRVRPDLQVLFTWADGLRGKPGYIYQADNWRYGGYIETEVYVDGEDAVWHPRRLITRYGRRDRAFTTGLGLRKVKGYQFRYVRFVCSRGREKALLRESPVDWTQPYPKRDDLRWRYPDADEGSRVSREAPSFEGLVQFQPSAPFCSQRQLFAGVSA